jgi:hypothetical protein
MAACPVVAAAPIKLAVAATLLAVLPVAVAMVASSVVVRVVVGGVSGMCHLFICVSVIVRWPLYAQRLCTVLGLAGAVPPAGVSIATQRAWFTYRLCVAKHRLGCDIALV